MLVIVKPAKVVKEWFVAHPQSVVSFHWRWAELGSGARERLELRRSARVVGNRIIFSPHQSEMSLKNVTDAQVTDNDRLRVFFSPGNHVEYTAVG